MTRLFTLFGFLWLAIALAMYILGLVLPGSPVFTILAICFAAVGVVFFILALIARIAGAGKAKRREEILVKGVETTGTITFLDRNFSVRIGGRTPYSFLEYRYTDAGGREHTVTDRWADFDQIIRRGWQVGTTIPLRYLATAPGKSAIVH